MHFLLLPLLAAVSALSPARQWTPRAALNINVNAEGDSKLMLTDFTGATIEPKNPQLASVSGQKTVNLKDVFDEVSRPGTYVLYVVPNGKGPNEFTGTPLVIEARSEKLRARTAEPMVTKVQPLEYVLMTTDKGPMTMVMYYDVAPVTCDSFLYLCRTGYYDGLTFHRIVPDFVIQGGDPRGDGTGGRGYNVQAEFNDRKHDPGVLWMARQGDPNEQNGGCPVRNTPTAPAASSSSASITRTRNTSITVTPLSARSSKEWKRSPPSHRCHWVSRASPPTRPSFKRPRSRT